MKQLLRNTYVDILIIPPSVMEISSVPYGAFIQCTKGSAAEAYAKKHNIDYYACDPEDLNNNGGTTITPQPKPQPQPAPTVPKNGVKNNRLYKNGKKVTGTKVVKVGKKTYYIKNGKVQKGKKAVKYKNKLYAVNNGVVMTAKKTRVVKVGKKSYIVSRKGIVSHPKKGYKQYKVGKKKYIVNKSGVIQKNKKRIRIGKRIYRTNKKGIVVKVTKRK